MSMPSVEVAWGGGQWRKSQKTVAGPIVRPAVELARDGLEWLAVDSTKPKQMDVWRVADNDNELGRAIDASVCELYVNCRDFKYPRRFEARFPTLVQVSFHELLHCVRAETFEKDTLLERAASEGISYVATDMLGDALMTDAEREHFTLEDMASWTPSMQADVLGGFLDDCLLQEALEAEAEASGKDPEEASGWLYDKWFDGTGSGGFPAGVKLGVFAVNIHIQEGRTIPELMEMPADGILQVAL